MGSWFSKMFASLGGGTPTPMLEIDPTISNVAVNCCVAEVLSESSGKSNGSFQTLVPERFHTDAKIAPHNSLGSALSASSEKPGDNTPSL